MFIYGHWLSIIEFDPKNWVGFIYLIEHKETKRKYIGKKQFINTLRKKIKNRKNRKIIISESNWKTYTSSSEDLNQDINNLGKDNFIFTILKLCKTKKELFYSEVEEQFKRNVLNSTLENGLKEYYNRNIMNKFFSDQEIYEKSSKTRIEKGLSKGENNPMFGKTGENHPLFGIPCSEERKKKISEANKGRKFTIEHKVKISKSKIGKERSPETKEKLRIANSGKHLSNETKEKIRKNNSKYWSGKHLSNETKEKIRNTLLGKKQSEKTRDKISYTFEIISPENEKFVTNRLKEFSKEKFLSYVSLLNSSKTRKPIKKGKSKNWICLRIN